LYVDEVCSERLQTNLVHNTFWHVCCPVMVTVRDSNFAMGARK